MEDQIPILYDLSYSVKTIPNEDGIEEPFDYVIDFYFSENENKIIRINIEEDTFLILSELNETEGIIQYNNIGSLFYLLIGIGAIIKSVFISVNEDEELDLRFTILVPHKGLFILNFDILTGIILSFLFKSSICITQELFEMISEEVDE